MNKKIFWRLIEKDGGLTIKIPFSICERCNNEYTNNNIFASKHCLECSEKIKREKTRERVRQYRKRNANMG